MIRPRRNEVKAIVELLEDEGYETAEALATEILKRTYVLFGEREWFIWAHGDRDGQLLLYGPFAQQREAVKLATQAALGGENRVYRVFPPAPLARRLSESRTAGRCQCGHLAGLHEHDKSSQCWAGQMVGRKWTRTCPCQGYQEAAA